MRREVGGAGVVACEKNLPQDIAVASSFLAVTKFVTAHKPLIHRHFYIASAFARKIARAEIFLPRRGADGVVARRLRKPDRAITHKI
ncbi:MAG: hypothetical protein WB764_03615 [Xanthobacteraceae bacterium]